MTIPFGYLDEETEVNGTEKEHEVVTEEIQSATDPLVIIESNHIESSSSHPGIKDFEDDPLRKIDSTTVITVTESTQEITSSQLNLSNVENPEATTLDSLDLMRMAPLSGAVKVGGSTTIATSDQPKGTTGKPVISSVASVEADITTIKVPDPRDASSETAGNTFIPPALADVTTENPAYPNSSETAEAGETTIIAPHPEDLFSDTTKGTTEKPALPNSTATVTSITSLSMDLAPTSIDMDQSLENNSTNISLETFYDEIQNEINATLNSSQKSIESKTYKLHTDIFTRMEANYTRNIIFSCLNSGLEETEMVNDCLYVVLYILLVFTCIIAFFCCCYLCSCVKKEH